MARPEIKPLIVRQKAGQPVIILPPENRPQSHHQRLKITDNAISFQPTALEKLDEKVMTVANDLAGLQGGEYESQLKFLFNSPNWAPIIKDLRTEQRNKREIFKEIMAVLVEGGASERRARSQARTMYEELVKRALEVPKPGENKPFTRKNVW